ncbi:hypothetical protein ACWIGW_40150 [Nocardia brasiliensis]
MVQPQRDIAGPVAPEAAGAAIQAIRDLVDARDIRAAKQELRRTRTGLDDHTWAMIGEIANTLRYKTHDVAVAKLRKLWRDNEQYRGLIEACVPKTDGHQYVPDSPPLADRRHEPRRPRPGRVTRRIDPSRRTDPRQRTNDSPGTGQIDSYETQLTHEDRREPGTPRDELIVDRRDYDRDAAAEVTEPLCVSCRLERACIDRWTGQITTGHGDDGLCGTCREDGRQGIPELPLGHTRAEAIQARLDTIAANFDTHAPALFRHEWRFGNPLTKSVTQNWVEQHNPGLSVRPTVTTELIDLNGECAKCSGWRQLRDDQCVDCHPGLAGEVVIAGALDPLVVRRVSGSAVVNDDNAFDQVQDASEPFSGTYVDQFMDRLTAAPKVGSGEAAPKTPGAIHRATTGDAHRGRRTAAGQPSPYLSPQAEAASASPVRGPEGDRPSGTTSAAARVEQLPNDPARRTHRRGTGARVATSSQRRRM